MSNLLSPDSLPRRPETLAHSRSPSLPIAEEFGTPSYSPLLTPRSATTYEDQEGRADADDVSSRPLLRSRSYTDADDASTRTLLRQRSNVSNELEYHVGNAYFPTEADDDDVPGDQEASYTLATFQPKGDKQPTEADYWKSRQSYTSQPRLAVDGGGWWWHQMLVDRSLRSMAALTSVFALMMVILSCAYLPAFVSRPNKNSTSVGGKSGENCKTMEGSNVVCLYLWFPRDGKPN